MKPLNSAIQRHKVGHYRTRLELESAAQDNKLVEKLISDGILRIHSKWRFYLITKRGIVIGPGHKIHPQAPYSLNVWELHELESSCELLSEEFC